jgi:hypothetical protein
MLEKLFRLIFQWEYLGDVFWLDDERLEAGAVYRNHSGETIVFPREI